MPMLANLLPKYDRVLFSHIHQVSTFLPPDENEDSIRSILHVAGIVTVGHLVLLRIVKLWLRSGKKSGEGGGSTAGEKGAAHSLAALKASYQLTNLLVNLTLGCLGIYHYMALPSGESIADKIVGYEHVKLFSVVQVGYQLWALIMGVFFVGELKSMILHHVAVICLGTVSAFVRCGFRYYTPYFYGLIEISSVPLSVVNAFKDNQNWIKAYPEYYGAVRLVFGATFLLLRVILWTPIYWSFFINATMLVYSSESMTLNTILTCFNLSASLILTMLQYYWASKIISTWVKGAGPKKKGE